MAIVNTSTSMKKSSVARAEELESTEKNIKKMMAEAGCPEYTSSKTIFPRIPGNDGDDVVFVGMNGVNFYFPRGKQVSVPNPLLDILTDCGVI